MERRELLKSMVLSPLVTSFSSSGEEGYKLEPDAIDGFITPDMFGAKPDGVFNNKQAIEKALQYANLKGRVCYFLPGNYYSEDIIITVPVKIAIHTDSYLDFNLTISGEVFCSESSFKIEQDWRSFGVGTSLFTKSNNKLNKGDVISVSLATNYGGNAEFGNENGIDILNITDVSDSFFSTDKGIRFPYAYPIIKKLKSVESLKGDLLKGTYIINGDFSNEFSQGDVIRIENIDGIDGVGGSKNYFEYVKIKSIDKINITLCSRTIYSHTNPWLIKTMFINRVEIIGRGRIKELALRNVDDLQVSSLFINRIIISNCYGVKINDLNLEGLSKPTTLNMTYCFGKSIIENLNISNSQGDSDNASIKIMSSPQVILSNVVLSDSNSNSKKQSNYSLFIDAFYTPYSCWNDNIIVNNIICERPKSNFKRGAWFYGMRNSVIESVIGADIFLQGASDCYFNNLNISAFKLEIKDLVRCNISSKCENVLIKGGMDNIFKLELGKLIPDNSNIHNYRCRFTNGAIHPETGETYISGVNNYVSFQVPYEDNKNASDIYVEYQESLFIEPISVFCVDVKDSINIGKGVSNIYIKNFFEKIK
ncbi:Uncharacterised protein [Klebsiella pneumoniae]|uniref:hypothetical protein n=1 Tax=Klebsiella pneumoniae TaxID=573 RepID=UPI000E2B7D14|nr:hypothetical protein [Klebsiella pneumoniae]SYG64514.1 Uncharacterised protein [Klebsiella pneumoniae]